MTTPQVSPVTPAPMTATRTTRENKRERALSRTEVEVRAFLLILGIALTLRCTRQGPDLVVPSRDGRRTASVRNHWSIDPPRQTLWLDDTRVATLGEDMDWCRTVVWSEDGSTVAYLVQDAKLIVVDAASGSPTSSRWLVEQDGYPSTHEVRNLTIDGASARYRSCVRGRQDCSGFLEASIR
jgi:hypothetical protein